MVSEQLAKLNCCNIGPSYIFVTFDLKGQHLTNFVVKKSKTHPPMKEFITAEIVSVSESETSICC